MRERTELFGGTFRLDSARDGGTTITIAIPLSLETEHEEDAVAHR
jgi:signal transduction histidine kinase